MIKHTKNSRKLSRNPSKSVRSNAPELVRTASSFAQPFQNDRIVYKIFGIPVPAEIGYQLDFHFDVGNNLSKSWIRSQTVSSHLYNKFCIAKVYILMGFWMLTTNHHKDARTDSRQACQFNVCPRTARPEGLCNLWRNISRGLDLDLQISRRISTTDAQVVKSKQHTFVPCGMSVKS